MLLFFVEGPTATIGPQHDQEVYMRAAVLCLLMLAPNMATAEGCACEGTDAAFFYTTANPDEAEFMEEFLWEIVSCEPVYDLQEANEPIVSFDIEISFVMGDNPALETYFLDENENEKVLRHGQWMRFDEFERSLSAESCAPAVS